MSSRPRRAVPDSVCVAAVDAARSAAEAEAYPDPVGEHLGVEVDEDRVVTHLFASASRAYRGWRWAVTVARASRAKVVTVDEVVLLPGAEALLAPPWVPWQERLRPGDLGVGDVLPSPEDDPRLEPGYAATGEEDVDAVALWELGLGRIRVLSRQGRFDAAQRWYDGESGPHAAIALAAPGRCAGCGFYLPMAGALRLLFGVCANAYAPDDARVVSADHGCGAHSEAAGALADAVGPLRPRVDETGVDLLDTDEVGALGHS
ncbi:MAG: DUF3027 domain-containing protein [Actinomycetes bacterium]